MPSCSAAVVQPSYIPWRGYFDLIRRSDVFVFYDDVQYDKHGWRNRNRIKTAQGLRWLTVPVHAKGNTLGGTPINRIRVDHTRDWKRAHAEQLRHSYARAPFYERYRELTAELYASACELLADFTIATTIRLARHLGIEHTRFLRSSEFAASGAKTDRLIDLLQQIGATHYISGPSARAYIETDKFARAGISLEYAAYDYAPYEQSVSAVRSRRFHPRYDFHAGSASAILFRAGTCARRLITRRAHRCACRSTNRT